MSLGPLESHRGGQEVGQRSGVLRTLWDGLTQIVDQTKEAAKLLPS